MVENEKKKKNVKNGEQKQGKNAEKSQQMACKQCERGKIELN